MTVSAKLGIASILLVGSIFVRPFANWRGPIDVACAVISAVLGLLASQRGSKWWLVIPGAILAGFGICLYVAFHSY
jgi:hypothetical protein